MIFFALFLAAAARFGLRVGATWIGMTAALSATLVATYAFDLRGLPALPALSLGFLLPNADLVWRSLTTKGRGERRAPPSRPEPPARAQQFCSTQASMFCDACCTSAESIDVRDLLQLREGLGARRLAAREVDALERLGDLREVLRDHLVVVLDLVRHLVGDLVECLRRVLDVRVLAAQRLGDLRRHAGELRAFARQVRRSSVVRARPGRVGSSTSCPSTVVSVATAVTVSELASLLSLPPQPAATSATAAMRSAASLRPFTSSPFVSSCAGRADSP